MYSLQIIWHHRNSYLPGILAVTFSTLLIALQCGLLMGLFKLMALPVDQTSADIWVGFPDVPSVDIGRPIPTSWYNRLAEQPEVVQIEFSRQGFAPWNMPKRDPWQTGPEENPKKNIFVSEGCMIMGSRMTPDSIGTLKEFRGKQGQQLAARLRDPGTIIVDVEDRDRLGIRGEGDIGEIAGQRVRVVGLIEGYKSLAAPFIFCSLDTARSLLRQREDQTTYLLARCGNPEDAQRVVDRLKAEYAGMAVFTRDEFSAQSSWYWLMRTKAGFALGLAALLGFVVGIVVTSQTLYAATATLLPYIAVLEAQGLPRWRSRLLVMTIAFWVGILGVGLAIPITYLLAAGAELVRTPVNVPWQLIGGTAAVTIGMALMSGLASLRLLRGARAENLR